MTDSQRRLAEEYLPWALRLASRWTRRWPWISEEIVSRMQLELCLCVQQYDGRGDLGIFLSAWLDVARRNLLRQWVSEIRRKVGVWPDKVLDYEDRFQAVDDRDFRAWVESTCTDRELECLRAKIDGTPCRWSCNTRWADTHRVVARVRRALGVAAKNQTRRYPRQNRGARFRRPEAAVYAHA
jgi:hypothetical protein